MTQRELTPADYMAMLRRRWILIAVLAVIGAPLAYGVSLVLPARYMSQTLVLVDQQTVPTDFVRPVDTTDISQRLSSMQEQILSRTRLEPLIHQFGLFPKDVNREPAEMLVARLRKAIEVTPVRPMEETRAPNLPGFIIDVTLDNPRTAQQVCTAITSMFIEQSLSTRQQHSEDTTQFLTQQLADAKAKLDEQDAKLAAFKSHYLGILPEDEQTNLNLLTGLTSQLDAATQALARAQQDKSFAESMLTQQLAAWQESQSGRSPDTLEQQLAALRIQLANLEARYTEDYPDVIKTKNDIASLQKRIADGGDQRSASDAGKPPKSTTEPPQVSQLRAQLHTYDQVITEKAKEQEQIKAEIKLYQQRVQSSPVVEQQYKELTRGYQTAQDTYSDLQKKRDASQMATELERQQEGEQFRVLDPANLPDKPAFPDRTRFALSGLGGGLALGFGLAFLLEMRDSSMRTERDVEFILRLPVLAMVPDIGPLAGRAPNHPAARLENKSSLGLGAGA
jgi:polysaccharide chain length determinant protein (PEP-CTERM system associated)